MVMFFKAWRKGDGRAASEIEALIESLRSQPPSERRGANVSLTDCGVSNAFVAPLVKATQDPDAYLRESAVCALGHYRLGDLRKARLAVLTALRSDAAPAVRAGAAGALSCCAEKAQAALLDALRDASPLVRSAAVSSLAAACGEVEIEALKRCMLTDQDPDVRHSAAYELGAMKDERLVSALLQAAHDASEVVRAAALYGVCESAREDRTAVLPA